MFVDDKHSKATLYCGKVPFVKDDIESSSTLQFITNSNLFVNAKTLTDYSTYFKDLIQYIYFVTFVCFTRVCILGCIILYKYFRRAYKVSHGAITLLSIQSSVRLIRTRISVHGGGGGTPYNSLYEETPAQASSI